MPLKKVLDNLRVIDAKVVLGGGFPTQLDRGSTGHAVNVLGDFLFQYLSDHPGFSRLVAGIELDAQFQNQIFSYLKLFQEYCGLDIDGRCGPNTQTEKKRAERNYGGGGMFTPRTKLACPSSGKFSDFTDGFPYIMHPGSFGSAPNILKLLLLGTHFSDYGIAEINARFDDCLSQAITRFKCWKEVGDPGGIVCSETVKEIEDCFGVNLNHLVRIPITNAYNEGAGKFTLYVG